MTEPRLFVFTGAGLSAESGLATFRSAGGLWQRYDMDRVANALTWKRHREEVFEFFALARDAVAQAQPNEAHCQLARWQQQWGPERVHLFTQNVDDLLERAGATTVTHLHGNLVELQCTACAHHWGVDRAQYVSSTRCPACNSLKGVKPAVVLFYEAAPRYQDLARAVKRMRRQDVVLVVGTSLEVLPAERLMPAHRKGDERVVLVDPVPSQEEWFGHICAQNAAQALPELYPQVQAWLQEPQSP